MRSLAYSHCRPFRGISAHLPRAVLRDRRRNRHSCRFRKVQQGQMRAGTAKPRRDRYQMPRIAADHPPPQQPEQRKFRRPHDRRPAISIARLMKNPARSCDRTPIHRTPTQIPIARRTASGRRQRREPARLSGLFRASSVASCMQSQLFLFNQLRSSVQFLALPRRDSRDCTMPTPKLGVQLVPARRATGRLDTSRAAPLDHIVPVFVLAEKLNQSLPAIDRHSLP